VERIPENIDYPRKESRKELINRVERIPESIHYRWKESRKLLITHGKNPEKCCFPGGGGESRKVLITRGKNPGNYWLPVVRIPENIDYPREESRKVLITRGERIPESIHYPWKKSRKLLIPVERIPESIDYLWKESRKIMITCGNNPGNYWLPVERISENIDCMANSLKNEIHQKCDLWYTLKLVRLATLVTLHPTTVGHLLRDWKIPMILHMVVTQ